MKAVVFVFLFCFLCLVSPAQEDGREKTYKGRYTGHNLKVKNPYSFKSRAYCISHIYVNGVEQELDLDQTLVEVDLSHLAKGQDVAVKIIYKQDCTPIAVNLADML